MHAHRANVSGNVPAAGKLMTYLQREQYSQLRLFTCCEESEALSLASKVEQKHTNRGGGERGGGHVCACGDRFISKRVCVCAPRQECVRYDFYKFFVVFRSRPLAREYVACNSTRPRWIIIVLYTVLLSDVLSSSPSYSFTATLLAIIHFLPYHDFRMLVFSLRPDAALAYRSQTVLFQI